VGKARRKRQPVKVDGIPLKRILNKRNNKEWIHLAQDRDKWQAVVKTIMNLRGSIKCGVFLEQLTNC
jgi:hypothetical protein